MSTRRAVALLILALAGCDDPAGLFVDLKSDLVPGPEFDRLELRVFSGADTSAAPVQTRSDVRLEYLADATEGVRIAELPDLGPGTYLVVVELLRGDIPIAEGRVLAELQGPQVVTVQITRDCVGIDCDSAGGVPLACRNGGCDDARCGPEHPELCMNSGCTADAECATGAPACVREACVGGACFSRPDDAACPERCDATRGCVAGGTPLIPPVPGGDATFYVSTSGDDNNDGSMMSPWATLTYAATQVGPGDVVEVLDGVYAERVLIEATGEGPAPIVFRSTTGGAVIDGASVTDMTDPFAVTLFNARYVTLHGFEIQGAFAHCVRVLDADAITLQGMNLHDCGSSGVGASFSDDLWMVGNEVHASETGLTGAAVGERLVVDGNYLHDLTASAVYTESGQNDIDRGGDGFGDDARITRNVIQRTGMDGGAALNLAGLRAATLANNLLVDNLASGIALFAVGGSATRGSLVAHNTVVFLDGEGRSPMVMHGGATENRIHNNVFLSGSFTIYDTDNATLPGNLIDDNLVFTTDGNRVTQLSDGPAEDAATWRARGLDEGSVFETTGFVDPSRLDYSLAANSPARDAGRELLEIGRDLRGATRAARPDLGAFESLQ